MEISVTNQLTHAAMESELVSRTTAKMVNLDHTKEFQECMDTYEIGNGVHSFNMIALAIAFMNPPVTFVLLSQRVQHIITSNIQANNTWDVIFIFPLVNTMVLGCYI